MPRLPFPGGDEGTWGEILNEYLRVEHNDDGTQKTLAIAKGGTGATTAASARSNLGAASTTDLSSHTSDTNNPHSVAKAQIALGNVDNTSDTNKPVSTATQTALDAKLAKSGDTMSGTLELADNVLSRPEIKDYAETVSTNATSGVSATLDLENGNFHDLTLTANCTLTFSNPPTSGKAGSFTLLLRQDGVGSRTVTWPASVRWPNGVSPLLSSGANKFDVLTFFTINNGTIWVGFLAGANFS